MKVAMIGECMIELNGAPFGAMNQSFGGDTLNAAIYLKRAIGKGIESLSVHYITAVGVDPLSKGMVEYWRMAGINTDLVLEDPNHQLGLYLIQLNALGERTFLYWRSESAARYLLQHKRFEMITQALWQMDVIYLSGISLAILPASDREKLILLLEGIRHSGKKIVFDTNYRPALWGTKEDAKECYEKVFSLTSLALVTDDDEQALWGDETPFHTLVRLTEAGVEQAVVKQGAKGCLYQNLQLQHPVMLIPAIPVKNVVDTTSAGDAFNAGYLAGYLAKRSPMTCAMMGHQMAAVVIQHKGAIIPSSNTQDVVDGYKLTEYDFCS
ncbi:MAG: sugar kinase [Aeromonas veronii]